MTARGYALVTPARNEEANIERLLEAVISQTIQPRKWIIVSDGSVDRTDEIVARYAQSHRFIQLLRAAEHRKKDFGSKVKAFQEGYNQLEGTEYSFVGNLDADVSFEPDYFERTLERFQANARLGIVGGLIFERIGDQYVPQRISSGSVAGAVQLFRRECFEAIGGYIPMKSGGIDAAAEIMARMHGWTVQTFPEIQVYHHRRVSTGKVSILASRFQQGVEKYLLGYDPYFHAMSCAYRIFTRPYFIGSVLGLLGYGWSCLRGYERSVPNEVVKFLRAEQRARITLFPAARKTVREN